MSKSDVIVIQLDAMSHRGQALGRDQGKVVFVPYGIPGEVVRARLVEERKRWSRAHLVRVLEPSAQRVEAPCPHFGVCGGCQWQHIDYAAQLDYKRQIAIDQLRRVGGVGNPQVQPARGMEDPWRYRNHVQFSFTGSGLLGFQAARSHDVVPVDHCLLLHPLLDELHAAMDIEWPDLKRLSLRAGVHTGERMVVLELGTNELPALDVDMPLSCVARLRDGTTVTMVGQSVYHEMLCERRFRVSASSFFQVNTAQTEVLLDTVASYLAPEPDDVLLDVYCGVGTLGLSMVDRVAHVIGIEAHPAAIQDAWANADDSGAVTLIEGTAEQVVPQLAEPITKAVLDPPREGCAPDLLDALVRLAPRRIVYVSCNPSSLARDGMRLLQGNYQLVSAQPVDMFPQTHHVETVSLWQRVEAAR